MLSAAVASVVIGAHIHTLHIGGDGDLPPALRNTDHTPGLYVRTESGLTAGIARNSLRRTSVYLAKTWTTDDERWSLSAGAITGYRYRAVYGQHVCRAGYVSVPENPCRYEHGKTRAHLRPLIAPSWRGPDVAGFRPRVALLGKALSISLERTLP